MWEENVDDDWDVWGVSLRRHISRLHSRGRNLIYFCHGKFLKIEKSMRGNSY